MLSRAGGRLATGAWTARRIEPLVGVVVDVGRAAPRAVPARGAPGAVWRTVETAVVLAALVGRVPAAASSRVTLDHAHGAVTQCADTLQALALEDLAAGRVRRAHFALGRICDMWTECSTDAERAQVAGALERGFQALAGANAASAELHPVLALASLYDRCVEQGVVIPNGALSKLVATMAGSLPEDTLLAVLDTIAEHFVSSVSSVAAAPQASKPAASVLAVLLSSYGKVRHPERGEAFLARYAEAHGAQAQLTCTRLARLHRHALPEAAASLAAQREQRRRRTVGGTRAALPHDVPLHDVWSSSTTVWNALVRSRTLAGDTVAARTWLDRFRVAASALQRPDVPLTPPRATASPYLTLMHAYSTGAGIADFFAHATPADKRALQRRVRPSDDAPYKSAAVHSVLSLLRRDGVAPGVSMLNFLASFEAGRGRTRAAARLVCEALRTEHGPAHVRERSGAARVAARGGAAGAPPGAARAVRLHVSTLVPVFTLHAACATEHGAPFADVHVADASATILSRLATPRQALGLCAQMRRAALEDPAPGRAQRETASFFRSRGTALLNEALQALMKHGDLAGAYLVLRLYDAWGIRPDLWTQSRVWAGVAPQLPGGVPDATAACGSAGSPLAAARAVVWRLLDGSSVGDAAGSAPGHRDAAGSAPGHALAAWGQVQDETGIQLGADGEDA